MTSRGRNFAILGVVAVLLVLSALVILPGTPLSKDTKLGLDLEGGIELVYEGLPDVQNADRAREQVGSTAQLQFYDWEPNILTGTEVYSGGDGLYDAALAASKEKGKAERTDVVPGSGDTPEEADRRNNTQEDRYYLFGPDKAPIGPDKQPVRTDPYEPSGSCRELLADYDEQ